MKYNDLERLCAENHLAILGGFYPKPADTALSGYQTLLMLGPDEPSFWPAFKASPEFAEKTDPMDQWSKRIVGGLAIDLGGKAFFPSDGPPYPPFFTWALATGRCHQSPINLLVHDRAGLMVSFRGALAVRERIELPKAPATPCDACTSRPCAVSCPIGALTPSGYDVVACKAYISTPAGSDCMQGCKARLSCPVSQKFGRLTEQSEFHQKAFLAP